MEQADWDLQAVVRGCCTTTTKSTNSTTTAASAANAAASTAKMAALVEDFKPYMGPFSSFGGGMVMNTSNIKQEEGSSLLSFPNSNNNPFEARNAMEEELHELYKPFVSSKFEAIISPHSDDIPKVSPFRVSRESIAVVPQKVKQLSMSASAASSSRSKRRKNQLKKVCHVSAEGVSSDIWSWRKYGQKPIKGSPYPRGYYKCSSCKGCLARKQVERNRSDPTMFIVTYTGEHSHPIPTHKNSLAGTTRHQKPQSPLQDEHDKPLNKPCTSSSLATMSTASADDEICTKVQGNVIDGEISDLMLEDEEETDEDMGVSDDFFEGLDEIIAGSASGDGTSPPFSGSYHLPFMTNNTTAAAGGS